MHMSKRIIIDSAAQEHGAADRHETLMECHWRQFQLKVKRHGETVFVLD
jgi:hypothetical protein